nr:metal-dependent hydrolase [uncultured Helicobacter sp.]
MIEIFGAGLVFICDEKFQILSNGGIAFESSKDNILRVGDYESLCAEFKNAKKTFVPNGILLPALINAHIHFEFGGHLAQFCYGDFGEWLDSLMANRDNVLKNDDFESIITQGIDEQIKAGVGSVGAISSYGDEMEILAHSPLRCVYFNEAIGSNPSAIDFLYANVLERLKNAKNLKSPTFTPALALHSPYSLHPIMAQKLVELCVSENLPLSAHFLESPQERQWLDRQDGYFQGFFKRLANIDNAKPFYTPQSFLEMLSPLSNALCLTHCLQITQKELELCENATLITCPRSNRLLNNAFLPLEILQNHPTAIGTDGKSSNNNVNLLDELRTALYAYPQADILELSKILLLSATLYGAKALGLNNGILAQNKNVDFAIFDFKEPLYHTNQTHQNQAPLHFILNASSPAHLYINAKAVI